MVHHPLKKNIKIDNFIENFDSFFINFRYEPVDKKLHIFKKHALGLKSIIHFLKINIIFLCLNNISVNSSNIQI